MKHILATLICYSITANITLFADQSPSHKKFTRSEISQAAKEKPSKQNQVPSSGPKSAAKSRASKSTSSNDTQKKTKAVAQAPSKLRPVIIATPQGEICKVKSDVEPQEPCEKGPSCFRFSLAHREKKGIGYNQGYSSLDMFFNFSKIGNARPFFDIRGHMTNDGRPAANVGFGVRYTPNQINAVFGINGFFDFKETKHSTFEQMGCGFEILGAQWKFTANGYFPIIKTISSYYKYGQLPFYQVNLSTKKYNIAMKGSDVNLCYSLLHRGFYDLNLYLGGYYFEGHKQLKSPGGYGKFTSNISRYFSLEVMGSYDTLFKGIVQGAAAINIPIGKRVQTGNPKRSCYTEIALARNNTMPVSRFEMIISKTKK
jgi:hypothetical protein